MESLKKYVSKHFTQDQIKEIRNGEYISISKGINFEHFHEYDNIIEEWVEGVEDLFYPDLPLWENKVIFAIEMIVEMI